MRSFLLSIILQLVLTTRCTDCLRPKSLVSSFSLDPPSAYHRGNKHKGSLQQETNDVAVDDNYVFDTDVNDESFVSRGGEENKKVSDFKVRAISAIVVLSALYLLLKNTGRTGIIILILGGQIGMFDEVTNVSGVTSDPIKWLALAANLVYWDGQHLMSDKISTLNLIAFGLVVLHIAAIVFSANMTVEGGEFGKALKTFCTTQLSAYLVVGASSSWLATLNAFSAIWIMFPGLLVIINDTMAYICGVLAGKNPLLPKVSPKKTWEGFIGAAVFTIALTKPIWKMLSKSDGSISISDKHLYFLALYVSIVAPFGGFLASTIKRTYGYKDFGAVMPGHGGLVDRLDCQLLTAPFVYLYLTMIATPEG